MTDTANLTASEVIAAMADPGRKVTGHENLDPAPDPIEAARQRASDFVRNIATNTKLTLRQRRDELDNTMERITKSESALTHYIGEFARFNHEALNLSKEIGDLIEQVATPFKADPPTTITQLKTSKDTE